MMRSFGSRPERGASTALTWLRMPTVLRVGPYRFYFYSHETTEPPHIHVDRENRSAKFWLMPVALARNLGFRPTELRKIQLLVEQHQVQLREAWHEHFKTQGR